MHLFSLLLLSGVLLLFTTLPLTTATKSRNKFKKKPIQPLKVAKKSTAGTIFEELEAPDNEVATRLDANGEIKDAKKYGVFEKICGKTYLFGSKKVTWTQNWKSCCSLGMAPVIFETLAERKCLSKIADEKADKAFDKGIIVEENPFWLGGYRDDLDIDSFNWCSKNLPKPIDDLMLCDVLSTVGYGTGVRIYRVEDLEPSRHFKFLGYHPSEDSFILEKNDAKSVILACESVDNPAAPYLAPNSNCRTKCKPIKCKNYKNYEKLDVQQEKEMQALFQKGEWISKQGLYFFVAKILLATQEEARQTCCQLGANLVSIKSVAKRSIFEKLVKDLPQLKGDWWTSGTDEGCDGNFRWCSVDRPFIKGQVPPWAKGNTKASGDCVTLQLAENVILKTQDCSAKKKFICEFPGFGSRSMATVHKNCVNLLGLTTDQVKDLVDVSKYTYKMKCYLRCMGDILALLENGSLQEVNFMKASRVYLGYKDRYDENANTKTIAMLKKCARRACYDDSCENAFVLFKCLKERMPLLYERVLSWEFGIIKPRTCSLKNGSNMTCSKDQITLAEGSSVQTLIGVTLFKSEANFYGYSLEDAYATCCRLGMRMPTYSYEYNFPYLLEAMNGNNTDNFFGQTYSVDTGVEKWCDTNKTLQPVLSADGFHQLPRDTSVLVARKGELFLSAVPLDQIQQHVMVTQFFCEPNYE